MTSNSIVYRMAFSNTIGSVHQVATSVKPPMPVVVQANTQPPRMYSAILMPYITCMISGVPKPFSAMWRTIGITRSARGFLLHSAMSSMTGRLGWMNPIAAPSTRLVD